MLVKATPTPRKGLDKYLNRNLCYTSQISFYSTLQKAKINLIYIRRKNKAKGWNVNLNLSSSYLMQKINGVVYYKLRQQKAKVNFILR